jgi:hypothetical protein
MSGRDNRSSILPAKDTSPKLMAPSYDINDQIPTPYEIGVRRDGSLDGAVNAMKGMAYYVDTIGFGESSSKLSKGLSKPVQKFGINYFMPTGARCSNGADMWMFVETIPKGDALGKSAQNAMKQLGLPELRGLAPGIIEDAKSALDPRPLMGSLFGSGYPKCELKEQQVGDPNGQVYSKKGDAFVYDPQSVYYNADGVPFQKKWVQMMNGDDPVLLTKNQYDAERKIYNRDGTPIKPPSGSGAGSEGFSNINGDKLDRVSLLIAILLVSAAYLIR